MSIESKLSRFGKLLDSIVTGMAESIKILLARVNKPEKVSKRNYTSMTPPCAILVFDSFVAFLSLFISIHLRIGMDFLDYSHMYIIKNMFVFGLVCSSVFLWMQTHQSFWRYTSIEDLPPIFLSVILSNMLFLPLMLLMNQEDFLPYSVLIINMFVLTLMLVIPRFLSRMLYNQKMKKAKLVEQSTRRHEQFVDAPQVLLVGDSSSAEIFLRDIVSNDDVHFNFDPIGILTLDPFDVGRMIRGIPIVSELKDIHISLIELGKNGIFPRQIVITEKSIPENAKKFLVKYVKDHGLLLMHVIHQCMFDTVSE
ncbi:MAG: hypothetical protein LBT03_02695 [Holosporales bacterium]|jgi:O-antigen biosynthesis protein WbqV|nr:hypothetical protein [Holosporales bacterium]